MVNSSLSNLNSSDPKGPKFPLIKVKNFEKEFKVRRVRVKHYLYFLIQKANQRKSFSLLDWSFMEQKSRYVRLQLPKLYQIITKLLLEMKNEQNGEWINETFYFNKSQTWFDRQTLRTAYGISKGENSEKLYQIDELFQRESQKLVRNLVLLELGVSELQQLGCPVNYPAFKRGYDDKGHLTPEHEKRPQPEDPGEPNPINLAFGDDPESDIEVLELLGTHELTHFQKHIKMKI